MENVTKSKFNIIVENFLENAKFINCERYGNGHINGTYLVLCENGKDQKYYILQHINKNVFKKPELVMDNIEKVTAFMQQKAQDDREVLHFLKCCNTGLLYHKDNEGEYWRMYEYVDRCNGVDRPTLEEFYESGIAFGNFQSKLSDFPAETLNETIPDFHNTVKRFQDFLKAVDNNLSGRKNTCLKEIGFIKEREEFYSVLTDAHNQGHLPLRVSHNDTKSNNVLLDDCTHKAVCVIDLDTVMPGFSVTDFGDSIRFGASTAGEDEPDINKVNFDMDKFSVYAEGFIKGCGGKLPKAEMNLLPEGALMMTLECGMRFLSDYLDGDTYFKTDYPEHNLVRCRTQLKLARKMEKHLCEMKAIINKITEKYNCC